MPRDSTLANRAKSVLTSVWSRGSRPENEGAVDTRAEEASTLSATGNDILKQEVQLDLILENSGHAMADGIQVTIYIRGETVFRRSFSQHFQRSFALFSPNVFHLLGGLSVHARRSSALPPIPWDLQREEPKEKVLTLSVRNLSLTKLLSSTRSISSSSCEEDAHRSFRSNLKF